MEMEDDECAIGPYACRWCKTLGIYADEGNVNVGWVDAHTSQAGYKGGVAVNLMHVSVRFGFKRLPLT